MIPKVDWTDRQWRSKAEAFARFIFWSIAAFILSLEVLRSSLDGVVDYRVCEVEVKKA